LTAVVELATEPTRQRWNQWHLVNEDSAILRSSRNAQLAHFGLESCALHSELECGAGRPAENPVGFPNPAQAMIPLRLFQSQQTRWKIGRNFWSLFELRQRNLKFRRAGKDNRAFDDVLHLPDIARPGIANQRLHGRIRNGFDSPAHLPREPLGEMTGKHRD